jgi:Ca-activated chloride channel family protein
MLPERDGREVEVRLDPDAVEHAARLGAEATLTAVFDEGGDAEKIVRLPVRFARGGRPTKRFAIRAGEVQEVTP